MVLFVASAWAQDSYAVAASGAPDEASMKPLLDTYAEMNLPSHEGYPKAVATASLPGLPTKHAWMLVIAQPADKDVAERLAAQITALGLDAAAYPVTGGKAEQLQLLSVDVFSASGNGAPLFVYDVCVSVGEKAGPCITKGRPEPEWSKLVLPMPVQPKGTRISLWPDAGEPWTCTAVDAGPVKPDVALWLHGPLKATCFAPEKKKR
jgi:hypothetical protein